MNKFNDIFYQSHDGLGLYARDYACQNKNTPEAKIIFCMHGLTRNSKDFAKLAEHLSQSYRVICVDNRGRGRSEYDSNPNNYVAQVYIQDMFTLLDLLKINDTILCGTSMGGIMAFIMASIQPQRFSGIIINDVGPEIDTKGIARIKTYVGKISPLNSWQEAITRTKEINQSALPNLTNDEWEDFTNNIFRDDQGSLRLDYDPAIAIPFKDADSDSAAPNLWPQFEAIVSLPMLLIRGEISDLIDSDCVAKMRSIKPDLKYVEVPETGHTPTLNEAVSRAAIDSFLDNI